MQRRLVILFVFDFVCASALLVLNTTGFYENPQTPRRLKEAAARISVANSRAAATTSAPADSSPTSQPGDDLLQSATTAVGIAQVERDEAIKAKRVSAASLMVIIVNLFVLYPVMRRSQNAQDSQSG